MPQVFDRPTGETAVVPGSGGTGPTVEGVEPAPDNQRSTTVNPITRGTDLERDSHGSSPTVTTIEEGQLDSLSPEVTQMLHSELDALASGMTELSGHRLQNSIRSAVEGVISRYRGDLPDGTEQELREHLSSSIDDARIEAQELAREAAERDRQAALRDLSTELSQDARELSHTASSELTSEANERLEELRSRFGDRISSEEWKEQVAKFKEELSERREAAMKRELRTAARRQGSEDFDDDRDGAGDSGAMRSDIRRIAEKYGDITAQSGMAKEIMSTYESAYNDRREQLHDQWWDGLAWYEKAYHGTASFVRSGLRSIRGFVEDAISDVIEVGGKVIDGIGAAVEAVGELAGEAVEAVGNAVETVVNAVDSAVDYVTDPENIKAAWNKVTSVATSIGRGIYNAGKFLTSKETWQAAYNGLKSAVEFVTDPENIKKAFDAVRNGVSAAVDFMTDPATWNAVKNGLVTAGKWVVDQAVTAITDPAKFAQNVWNGAKAVGGFLKGVSDSIGLTDLVEGTYHLIATPIKTAVQAVRSGINIARDFGRVVTGNMSADEFKNSLKENVLEVGRTYTEGMQKGLRALKGAVMVAGELTGITDVVMMTKYALEGNYAMAAMHGAFALASAGSLAATIATGGAAVGSMAAVAAGRTTLKAAGKQILKTAAKEFLEGAAKEMGETVVKEVVERVGKEQLQTALRETTEQIVESGSRELAEIVTREGAQALTAETTERVMKDATSELMERTLRSIDLQDTVRDVVRENLEQWSKKSPRELRRMMREMGMSNKAAREATAGLRKALKTGQVDDELVEIFTKGISEEVTQMIERETVETFREQFAKTLRGEMRDASGEVAEHSTVLREAIEANARRTGRSVDEITDELVEAGTRGFRRGIREAVEKVVREGVEKALKEFRGKRKKVRVGGLNLNLALSVDLSAGEVPDVEQVAEGAAEYVAAQAESRGPEFHGPDKDGTRVLHQTDGSGNTVIVTQVWSDSGQNYITVGEQIILTKNDKKDGQAHQEVFDGMIAAAATGNPQGQVQRVSEQGQARRESDFTLVA